jgi:pimeloyl-ACP methyl ester carboxylesterase
MKTHSLLSRAEFGDDEFVQVGRYQLHYVEAGKGAPVILIPGSFCTYRTWNTIIPRLSPRFRVLALDYLGAGDSDKPRSGFGYTVEEQADLIAEMISTLRLGKTHLVGASYGGAIALNMAARHPEAVDKVISIEGGVVKPKSMPSAPLEGLLRFPILGDLVLGVMRTGALSSLAMIAIAGAWYPHMTKNERRRMLWEQSFNIKAATRIPWYRISIAHRTTASFEEEAKRIRAPILYVHGGQSDFHTMTEENIRFLREFLPHAQIKCFEDGIHDLQSQKPYEVAEMILEFLS